MSRRLPPLNALRAFEAAARHLSFTRAADELAVTQAAVSHQIRALEEHLGVRMFKRLPRGLLLTEEGQRYLPTVREAFERLAEATDRMRKSEASGTLTVSVTHSFGAKWLMPRLSHFSELYPQIAVRLSADDQLVDFRRDEVDLGIRYGAGKWPGVRADLLLPEEFFPVCSPRLVRGKKPLKLPSDLRHHTLLNETFVQPSASFVSWKDWLTAAGAGDFEPVVGPTFSHGAMVIAAAVDGLGVALARSAIAADDLAAGRLVRPFALALPGAWAHYIVTPAATADRPKIVAFRDWLLAEAGRKPNT